MKLYCTLLTTAAIFLNICGCAKAESQPLLICDLEDAHESISLAIHLHGQDGDRIFIMNTDEYGILSYSHEFSGEFAEIEFEHHGREFGVLLQKNKQVKMVIAQGSPIFSCDNKECNETCEAIRRIFGKENFIHSDDRPASYEEKTNLLNHSFQKVRQYIASISDYDLRTRLLRRAQRLHKEYLNVIDILGITGDIDEYNRLIDSISLYDDYLYVPNTSIMDSFASNEK